MFTSPQPSPKNKKESFCLNQDVRAGKAHIKTVTIAAFSAGAFAAGAMAVSALAVGALAIGSMVIVRMGINQARFPKLEIDDLKVGKWRELR